MAGNLLRVFAGERLVGRFVVSLIVMCLLQMEAVNMRCQKRIFFSVLRQCLFVEEMNHKTLENFSFATNDPTGLNGSLNAV